MKCLRNPIDNTIRRVTEAEGRRLARYGWEYVSKGEWKRSVRPDLTAIKSAAKSVAEGMASKMRRV